MFNNSKYTILYHKIILNAIFKNRKKSKNEYFESHHIIPKCFGGNITKNNLVLLTYLETREKMKRARLGKKFPKKLVVPL
jgi:acetoacetate decarboxylase